ncbi:alanine-glyoxylate transaminase/serine-glyoxylate transaminase/serine-pyruvate transaminase [Roseinatronobacter thiooxidans]|uniref:Alanine-glyoxylate transaminase/serine-glyoxylate transaminase/serine-pyruvate transaminase n=1 Tax=Roseinatronobacter thiooxidans TaxID=121821 RepID=A0A2W7R605_9RHOB|nr:aminotransferase class V-fold PLP-dependent enzyme [Roseinatronobacter thiooxidans]PZX46095.1 alanine-glyoxylate transaminase/serine-glyoxylate transaminase/serine-pyruvate transaminase [Roseinatronobacter thiooxidans]
MLTGTAHLFIPGPTNVPADVQRAMIVPMQDHRAPEFGALLQPVLAGLKPVFGTREAQIALLPGSGTAAWEAAITNTLNAGDKVLMARHGQFSALWADMAQAMGLQVEIIDVAWGAPCPVREVERRLGADRHGEIRAVFVTHNETATGVTSDVGAVRHALDACFHDALLFVDGVSSIGSIPFEMDQWGVDMAVAGSQKGLMCPAGLGILAASPRALAAMENSHMPRSFLNLRAMLAAHEGGSFCFTPPAQLLHGLRAALTRLHSEGLENVFARHHRLAEGVRAGVAALGLSTVAEHRIFASDTVTAIRTPHGIDAREVISIARTRYNTHFGGGLGPLAGKAFRIGHLGDLNEGMCLTALGIAELSLKAAGAPVTLGAGITAAQHIFAGEAQAPALSIAAE